MNSSTINQSSTDYASLVSRLRAGEAVECMIDLGIWKGQAAAAYINKWWGDLFTLTMRSDLDSVRIASEREFIDFCRKNAVGFNESVR